MTIERAVVKGTIASVVQTRSIFTADVVPSGGDTNLVLWDVYIDMFVAKAMEFSHTSVAVYGYDLYTLSAGHWELYHEVVLSDAGELGADAIANAVALVLLGKASGIRHVGRKFVSGLAEGSVTGNTMYSTWASAVAQLLALYISPVTGVGGGTLTPGITDGAFAFHPFVGGMASSILGSIRRRKPGRGI